MKVTLNQKTEKVEVKLEHNEKYDIEEHLHALLEFLSEQAMLWCAIAKRLEALERKLETKNIK
jgi:hypothetical protein